MIVDTSVSMALKNEFGKYDIKGMNLFKIEETNSLFKSVKLKLKNKNTVMVQLKCPLCGKLHAFNYCVSNIVNQEIIVCGCKTLGIPVLFIGEDKKIRQRVMQYNKAIKEIYAIF
ncbi:hypothetical protein ACJDT4_08750 [Clostridium neuense]|uniref:Uncharacterized protein n=1 Tax=Clostridium neuense TaxID=1728934 RepID=A0ABW8TFR7_9CLOT